MRPASINVATEGYLHLVEQQHTAELADRVQYSQLRDDQMPDEPVPDEPVRGQLPLPGTGDDNAANSDSNDYTDEAST